MEVEKGPDSSLLRPSDVLVHGLGHEPLAVDVGVVHTLQSSILLADVQPGQLTKNMERRKILERQALCKRKQVGRFRRSQWRQSAKGKANNLLQKLATVWANKL